MSPVVPTRLPPTTIPRARRRRAPAAALAALVVLALAPAPARAQVRQAALARIDLLNKQAMAAYDALEVTRAERRLKEALAVARQAGIKDGPAIVQTYLHLGIVVGAAEGKAAAAVGHFVAALRLDPRARLDPLRATPALSKLFAKARARAARERAARPVFRHAPVRRWTAGTPLPLRVESRGVPADRVVIRYRPEGERDFRERDMTAYRGGVYRGVIPAEAVRGERLSYYIVAVDEEFEVVASSGTAAQPHEVAVVAAGTPGSGTPPRGGGAAPAPEKPWDALFDVTVMAGAGIGFVAGGKESENVHPARDASGRAIPGGRPVEVGAGIAPAPFHLLGEVAYHINRRWQVAASLRVQVVNALSKDATSNLSFFGQVRAKRFFGDGPLRFYVAFGGGGGQIRHRISLGDYDGLPFDAGGTPDDRVDARVSGLGGAGGGGGLQWMFHPNVGLAVDLNLLVLFPDVAVHADLATGLVFRL